MKNNLSVVLIAHNEESSIAMMVEGLIESYDKDILEIVVVDDYSSDRTPLIVKDLQKKYKKVSLVRKGPPCGVGRALKTGFKSVNPKAEYILSMDSDFVQNIDQVAFLIHEIEKGYDGVIGSRFIKGGRLICYPVLKRIMNRFFHLAVRILFNIRCRDLSNNFKLYKKELFQELPYLSSDFAMNVETGILPIIYGYKIKEVPISWVERSKGMGKSKFSILKYGPSYIKVIFNLIRKIY
jgi:glycosyltransferase involved in cell wall biosynthesis